MLFRFPCSCNRLIVALSLMMQNSPVVRTPPADTTESFSRCRRLLSCCIDWRHLEQVQPFFRLLGSGAAGGRPLLFFALLPDIVVPWLNPDPRMAKKVLVGAEDAPTALSGGTCVRLAAGRIGGARELLARSYPEMSILRFLPPAFDDEC